ncbi:MAG: DUF3817 domain-containing protein [Demequina sp.]
MTDPAPQAHTTTATPQAVTPGVLLRYRVMAFVTGTLLILVFVGLLRYPLAWWAGFVETPAQTEALSILSQVHGFIYVVYLVTVLQLWMQARWGYGRLATLFFGGIVPLLSFFVESRVTREVRAGQES